MVYKKIKVEMDKGSQTAACRQSFTALDAIVRTFFTVASAANNEMDVRRNCD